MEHSSSKPRVSLRDVARQLNISHTTVSRALHDDPRITESLRRQVHRTAKEMGYRPDPMLTALAHYRQGKTEVPVATALAWINHWPNPKQLRSFREFDMYWKGGAATALKHGYHLEEFQCPDTAALLRLERVLLTRNIPGILIPPDPPHSPRLDWGGFNWSEFSVVRFGQRKMNPRFHLVTASQSYDGRLAFEKMRECGYQRIGFVSAETDRVMFLAGFLMAQLKVLEAQRLPPLLLPETAEAPDKRELVTWLKQNKPDAILTDFRTVRQVLGIAGYSVPDDIGLAALSVLDGNADAGIYQNPEEIGKIAVETLVSLIHNHHRGIPDIPREVLVSGRWQNGGTLPPRSQRQGRR